MLPQEAGLEDMAVRIIGAVDARLDGSQHELNAYKVAAIEFHEILQDPDATLEMKIRAAEAFEDEVTKPLPLSASINGAEPVEMMRRVDREISAVVSGVGTLVDDRYKSYGMERPKPINWSSMPVIESFKPAASEPVEVVPIERFKLGV
jgi:hypothetical protein